MTVVEIPGQSLDAAHNAGFPLAHPFLPLKQFCGHAPIVS